LWHLAGENITYIATDEIIEMIVLFTLPANNSNSKNPVQSSAYLAVYIDVYWPRKTLTQLAFIIFSIVHFPILKMRILPILVCILKPTSGSDNLFPRSDKVKGACTGIFQREHNKQ